MGEVTIQFFFSKLKLSRPNEICHIHVFSRYLHVELKTPVV